MTTLGNIHGAHLELEKAQCKKKAKVLDILLFGCFFNYWKKNNGSAQTENKHWTSVTYFKNNSYLLCGN